MRISTRSWRALLILCGGLITWGAVPASALARQTAGPADSLKWEHSDADLASAQVTTFLVCYDNAPDASCLSAPLTSKFVPTTAQGGPPAAGNSAYKLAVPALTPGAHAVKVKACTGATPAVCGNFSTTLGFTFQIVPGTPNNLGFIKGLAAVVFHPGRVWGNRRARLAFIHD